MIYKKKAIFDFSPFIWLLKGLYNNDFTIYSLNIIPDFPDNPLFLG